MVSIKTGSREDAIHVLINLWLKDEGLSCAYCGRCKYFEDCTTCGGVDTPLYNNAQMLEGFNEDIKMLRETRKNKHASNDSKSLRFGVSMPVGLYNFLNTAFTNMYKEDLFNEEYDIQWFMKKFGKYFAIPEEI